MAIDALQLLRGRGCVLLPAKLPAHGLTHCQGRIVRRDDLAHAFADHHLADRDGVPSVRLFPQAPAHVGVHGNELRANDRLAHAGFRDRRLHDREVLHNRDSHRPARQHDLQIGFATHALPPSDALLARTRSR